MFKFGNKYSIFTFRILSRLFLFKGGNVRFRIIFNTLIRIM